jgi:hypothetical protein
MREICRAAALIAASSGLCGAAPLVFAYFNNPSPSYNSTGTTSVTGACSTPNCPESITFGGTVQFNYATGLTGSFAPGLAPGDVVTATFTGSMSSDESGGTLGTNVGVTGWTGNLQFYLTPAQVAAVCASASQGPSCLDGLTNLLTVNFGDTTGTNNLLSGDGTSGSFTASEPPNTENVSFSSDFLQFGTPTQEGVTLTMFSSVALALTGGSSGALINNTYNTTGSFSVTPGPVGNFVPEPGSLTLIGGALIGLGLIGRKRVSR